MKRWMKSNSCHRSSLIGVRSGLTATMPRTKMPSRELPFSIRAPGGKPKPLGGIYDSVAIATCYGTYGTLAGRFQTFLFDRFIIIYYVPESLKMLFKISSASLPEQNLIPRSLTLFVPFVSAFTPRTSLKVDSQLSPKPLLW